MAFFHSRVYRCEMAGFPLRLAAWLEALLDPPGAAEHATAESFQAFAARHLDAHEERVQFPDEELRAFAAHGFAAAFSPGTCDWALATRLAFWLSAHDPDVALCLGGTVLGTLPTLVAGSDAQKARLRDALAAGEMAGLGLSEWEHGLDMLSNTARATPLGADGAQCAPEQATHFRLSGVKAPINNATRGELVTVLLRTADGTEANTQTLFVIDRSEVTRTLGVKFSTLGHRCMDLSSVVLDGLLVPASAALGKVGEGFFHTRRTLEISRAGVGAMATGLSVRAFALALEHAEQRHLYGDKVSAIPLVAELLADSFARALEGIAASRFTARMIAHAAVSARHLTCAAKLMLPQLLEQNVHACGTVLGARSLLENLQYARLRRTAPVYAVFDGSTLLQKEELWRCLITWRPPGSLRGSELVASWAKLADTPAAFDPNADDAEFAERLTAPALLQASAELLEMPRLRALAAAAHLLAQASSRVRRASTGQRRAASDCAGSLSSLASLAALTAVAEPSRRELLLPALRLRAAVAARRVRDDFEELALAPPDELSLQLGEDLATAPVNEVLQQVVRRCPVTA